MRFPKPSGASCTSSTREAKCAALAHGAQALERVHQRRERVPRCNDWFFKVDGGVS